MSETSLPQAPQLPTIYIPTQSAEEECLAELRAWRDILRKDFPLPKGVKVYLHISYVVKFNCDDVFAAYKWVGSRIDIYLGYNPDTQRMVADLWHEWAHLLCPGEKQDTEHESPILETEDAIQRFYWHGKKPKIRTKQKTASVPSRSLHKRRSGL